MNIWILEKIVKILIIINLQKIRKKIGQMFFLKKGFCNLRQKQDLDQNLLALANYFFSIMITTFSLNHECSPLEQTAWLFNSFFLNGTVRFSDVFRR